MHHLPTQRDSSGVSKTVGRTAGMGAFHLFPPTLRSSPSATTLEHPRIPPPPTLCVESPAEQGMTRAGAFIRSSCGPAEESVRTWADPREHRVPRRSATSSAVRPERDRNEARSTRRPGRRGSPAWLIDAPHAMDVDEVLRRLDVDEEVGLDAREVERRRRVVRRNALEQCRQLSGWTILRDQMRSDVVLLLVAAVDAMSERALRTLAIAAFREHPTLSVSSSSPGTCRSSSSSSLRSCSAKRHHWLG